MCQDTCAETKTAKTAKTEHFTTAVAMWMHDQQCQYATPPVNSSKSLRYMLLMLASAQLCVQQYHSSSL